MFILSMHKMKLNARELKKTRSKIRPSTKILPLNEEEGCHGKNPTVSQTIFFFNVLLALKVGKNASKRVAHNMREIFTKIGI